MELGSGRSIMVGDVYDDAADDKDGGFEDDAAMLRDHCPIIADEAGLVQLSTKRWLENDWATGDI